MASKTDKYVDDLDPLGYDGSDDIFKTSLTWGCLKGCGWVVFLAAVWAMAIGVILCLL